LKRESGMRKAKKDLGGQRQKFDKGGRKREPKSKGTITWAHRQQISL